MCCTQRELIKLYYENTLLLLKEYLLYPIFTSLKVSFSSVILSYIVAVQYQIRQGTSRPVRTNMVGVTNDWIYLGHSMEPSEVKPVRLSVKAANRLCTRPVKTIVNYVCMQQIVVIIYIIKNNDRMWAVLALCSLSFLKPYFVLILERKSILETGSGLLGLLYTSNKICFKKMY